MDAAWQFGAVPEALWARLRGEMARDVPKRYLNKLLMEYFVVEGHREAVAAFARESGVRPGESLESMGGRVAARRLLLEGKVADATAVLRDVSPALLDSRPDVRFRLARQEFIELVRARRVDDAIQVAEERLVPLVDAEPAFREALEDAMGLLAFPTPEVAPRSVRAQLSRDTREETARMVNSAALTAQGQVQDSRLPGLLKTLLHSQARLSASVDYPAVRINRLERVAVAYGRELLRSIGD